MRGDGEKGEAEGARRRERGKRVLRGRWQGEGNLAVVGQVIEIQQQVSELSSTLKATRKEKQDLVVKLDEAALEFGVSESLVRAQ